MSKNQPSSGSIISAIIFIVLLIALGVYSIKKNPGDKDKPTTKTNYNLKSSDSITIGPADAKVTFIEFSDYQCPACQYFASQVLPDLEKEYAGKVKFIFKQFPLSQHEFAVRASESAICANDQGKFKQYNDSLVKNYDFWTKNPDLMDDYAKEIKLNMTDFNTCKNSKQVADLIKSDTQAGYDKKIEGTPTIYINDEQIKDIQNIEIYRTKINALLAS